MDPVGRLAARYLRAALQPDDGVIYVGWFLPKMAGKKLLAYFPPVHPTVWVHHLTLWHFHDSRERPDLPWGKTVTMKVVGHAQDDRAQAVVVEVPTKFRVTPGRVPHVTISTASGVTPSASNDLLRGRVEAVRGVGIKAQVGWVDQSDRVHLEPPDGR